MTNTYLIFVAKIPDYDFQPAPISSSKLLRSSLHLTSNIKHFNRNRKVADFAVPWHVSISGNCPTIVKRFNGSHYCGGVIIHKKYILSAAHCFYGDGEFRPITGPINDFLHKCSFEVRAGGTHLNNKFEQVKETLRMHRYSGIQTGNFVYLVRWYTKLMSWMVNKDLLSRHKLTKPSIIKISCSYSNINYVRSFLKK